MSARRAPSESRGLALSSWLLGGVLLSFIVLPLLVLATNQSLASLVAVAHRASVMRAIGLSLEGALLAAIAALFLGVPLAYVLARQEFRAKSIVSAVVDIPLAVPHTVAGIALLFVFGRRGILGAPAAELGLRFWGTLDGIVVAMLFVAVPYMVNAARIGFENVDPRLERVARTLGLGPWSVLWQVTLPLAWRAIMTGFTLTFARAIAEFGAVVVLVYYPMTAPVKIYELFLRYGLGEATGMAVLLLVIALGLFVLLRSIAYERVRAHSSGGR